MLLVLPTVQPDPCSFRAGSDKLSIINQSQVRGTICKADYVKKPDAAAPHGFAGAGAVQRVIIAPAQPTPREFPIPTSRAWNGRRDEKQRRLKPLAPYLEGKLARPDRIVTVLETLLRPGDRVVLEGDNQKQADFLARSLAQVDPARVHGMLRLDGVNEEVEEGGAVRRHLPAAAVRRIRADDDETLLRSDIAKELDQRPSVTAGAVQRDDQGHGFSSD